jgi:NAD(P)-dependent dehydrogenase (short-subunit alcohol dehydrogenase family)
MPILEEFFLNDKVVFLAGNGEGHTVDLARAFAEAGAKIFIMAPNQDTVENSMIAISEFNGDSLGLIGDPSDPHSILKAKEALLPIWGRIDVLINNTRFGLNKEFINTTDESWNQLIDINLGSARLLSRLIGTEMLQNRRGKIIHIISGLAERGLWNSTAFSASQGAIMQLTRSLALEWARFNIQVNAIGIGWATSEKDELMNNYIPLKRGINVEEVCSLALFLASDSNAFISGSPIYIDGGLMSHP